MLTSAAWLQVRKLAMVLRKRFLEKKVALNGVLKILCRQLEILQAF